MVVQSQLTQVSVDTQFTEAHSVLLDSDHKAMAPRLETNKDSKANNNHNKKRRHHCAKLKKT